MDLTRENKNIYLNNKVRSILFYLFLNFNFRNKLKYNDKT